MTKFSNVASNSRAILLRIGTVMVVCLLAFSSASGFAAEADAPGAERKSFGKGKPFTIEELPVGKLKEQLLALPPAERGKAMAWLHTFDFAASDVAHIRAGKTGSIYYICPTGDAHDHDHGDHAQGAAPGGTVTTGKKSLATVTATDVSKGGEPITEKAPVSVASPPAYNSRPGAARTIYIDFNGGMVSGTAWNADYSVTSWDVQAWSQDSDFATFNDSEQTWMRQVWERLSEDYAPFDVNVSTDVAFDPANTTGNDNIGWLLICTTTDKTGKSLPHAGSGGVAYVGVFGNASYSPTYQPAWVTSTNGGGTGNQAYVAEAASHEMGHNMGLSHDGLGAQGYYGGHGTGDISWGPIMGTPYNRNVSQWSKGEYFNSNQSQDDLSIITARVPYIADDHGNTNGTATFVVPSGSGTVNQAGLIGRTNDVDVFSFATGAGTITLNATPFVSGEGSKGGNLDVLLELYNTSGTLITSNNPSTTTTAGISQSITAGTYFLHVKPVGAATPLVDPPTGYTVYGSLGRYTVSGTIILPGVAVTESGASTNVVEGGATDSYSLVLGTAPTANVVVTITPNAQVSVDKTSVTFTTANWNTPQTVTVTAVNDTAEEGPHTGLITHSVASGDVVFNGITVASVIPNITDNDVIVLTSPNGGESWFTGSSWDIQWNSLLGGNVKIELYKSNVFFSLIVASTPNNGLYSWTIPAGTTLGTNYKVRISSVETPAKADLSNADFTIAKGPIYYAGMNVNPPGWTLDTGWAFGVPTGANQDGIGGPDPTAGFNGPSVMGYNLAGDYGANLTATRWARTPAINCTGYTGVTLSFRRWLGVEGFYDNAYVQVSNNGTNWTQVWRNSTTRNVHENDTAWVNVQYNISAVADNQATVFIRWGLGTTDGDWNFSGWNIDEVAVDGTPSVTPPGITKVESGGATAAVEGGATDTYTLTLNSAPTADVTIAITPDTQVTCDKASVTFTSANWNTAQTVTVTAVNDTLHEFTHTGSILHTASSTDGNYNGILVEGVLVTITDNDNFLPVVNAGLDQTVPLATATLDGTVSDADGDPLTTLWSLVSGPAAITIAAPGLVDTTATFTVAGVYTLRLQANDTYGPVSDTVVITVTPSPLPTVAWTAASQASANETGTMTVTAQLSATSGQAVTVPFTVSGTATAADRSITTSPLTIAAGATTATATITITADALNEANETVILTIGTPTNATLGATTVHTATITDDDTAPTVAWTAASQASVGESGALTVTAQLSAVSGQAVTVPFTVTGTALSGTDYTITASPISIAAGATTGTATITITADTLDEANETVILTINTPTNATPGTTTEHTATITDNDVSPTVGFTTASSSGSESVTTVNLPVSLSAISGQTVTVSYAVSGGTATGGGEDYTLASGTLTFIPGTTSQTIPLTVVNDTLNEASETILVALSSPVNATLGTTAHTYTISDNDGSLPTVAWTVASQASGETGSMTVTAELSAVSGQAVTVPFTVSGTATAADRSITTSPLTIAVGATTATATITITADTLDEANETVILTIGTPTNATLGATTVHTATITDDDAGPTVAWAAPTQASVSESGTLTVTAQLSAVSGQAVTVPFTVTGTALSGTDYTITASPISIAAGATTGTATITITADTLDEANETVILTIDTPTNATLGTTTVHTATITDNDSSPTVSFTTASSSGGEATTSVNLPVSLSVISGQTVTVSYAVSGGTATGGGVDYTLASGTLTFTPGTTSQTIAVTVVNDMLNEGNETILVALSSPVNAALGTTTHTYTISDDDGGLPTVAWALASQSSAGESGTMTVTAELSAVSGQAVTVPFTVSGTATAADRSITTSPLTIAAGATTAMATITITTDALDEANETVILTIGTPTNATLGTTTVHTATITDDDTAPTVAWTAPTQASVSESGTLTVTAQLSAVSGQAVTVPFTVTGTASSGTDYTITASPISIAAGATTGTATITITADTLDEADETVILTINTPTNATPGTTTEHTATITDNDVSPTVGFTTASSSGSESVTTVNLPVSLSAISGQTVSVSYAVSGGTATGGGVDYTLASGTLKFDPGVTTQNIEVTVVDDAVSESNETIQVTLSAPIPAALGATSSHTYTITDNDGGLPTVAWTAALQSSGETGTMTVTAQLSATSALAVTVPFTVSGTASAADRTVSVSPISIAAGATTGTATITITADTAPEPNETVILTMGVPTNAAQGTTTVHTATIIDDDDLPAVSFGVITASGSETQSAVTIPVSLSPASGLTVTVTYAVSGGTATGGGVDYTLASGTLTFTPGSSARNIAFTVVNDGIDEADETIQVTLSNPANAVLGAIPTHTYTIVQRANTITKDDQKRCGFGSGLTAFSLLWLAVMVLLRGHRMLWWSEKKRSASNG